MATAQPSAAATARTPAPTVRPTPQPTSEPVAPENLAHVFSVLQNGIRLTVQLPSNPLRAGEVNRVTTSVANVGDDRVLWTHDGCSIPVWIFGTMDDARWRTGLKPVQELERFKEYATQLRSDGRVSVRYLPLDWLGRGDFGCNDVGLGDWIEPGQTLRKELAWDGFAHLFYGLPPSGRVTLTATFGSYWRPGMVGRHSPDGRITMNIATWIANGKNHLALDPGEVFDAALADPAFAAWAESIEPGNANDPICWYVPEEDLWWVGALLYSAGGEAFHYVRVDPRSGHVVDTVDRPHEPDDRWPY
jgi:hypothetical protein